VSGKYAGRAIRVAVFAAGIDSITARNRLHELFAVSCGVVARPVTPSLT